jgi:DNA mismatch repair protein MutS
MAAQGPAPPFPSILIPSVVGESAAFATEEPSYFGDLNLDQLVASVAARRGDYRIDGYFRSPLTDETSIGYRQNVFRDLEQQTVEEAVAGFCEAMQSMRRCLGHAGDKRGYARPRQRWFLDAISIYCQAVDGLGDGLGEAILKSEGFQAIRGHVEGYRQSERFTALRAETVALSESLDAITFSLRFHGARVTTRRYDDAPDYSRDVLATFDKFRQAPNLQQKRARDPFELNVNHVEEAIIEMAARLFPDEFARLADYCNHNAGFTDPGITAFDTQVQFYLAYLDFTAELASAGLAFCYPELTSTVDHVYATEAFDLALADRLRRDGATSEVVPNDFSLRAPEHILVVSGPNQGGKTTFSRMIGQLHFLASLGCPVPGTKARLRLFDQLFTHFEREESLVNLAGKLEDDLLRIQSILQSATRSSVIVINEIFTSTTLDDAVFLGREVLDRVMALGALTVMVSFIDELSTIGPATVSMVSTVDPDDATRRTYRVVRRASDGLAYAAALADKYRLSYHTVRDRVSR